MESGLTARHCHATDRVLLVSASDVTDFFQVAVRVDVCRFNIMKFPH